MYTHNNSFTPEKICCTCDHSVVSHYNTLCMVPNCSCREFVAPSIWHTRFQFFGGEHIIGTLPPKLPGGPVVPLTREMLFHYTMRDIDRDWPYCRSESRQCVGCNGLEYKNPVFASNNFGDVKRVAEQLGMVAQITNICKASNCKSTTFAVHTNKLWLARTGPGRYQPWPT